MADNDIEVGHDDLISQIQDRAAEEYARGSDASESGAKLKLFIEQTGMNSQALSWLKAIYKKLAKKDGQLKAMDIIRSLQVGLPMMEDHVQGQAPELSLDDPVDFGEGLGGQPHLEEEANDERDEFNKAVDKVA